VERHFEKELDQLQDHMLQMGSLVQRAIRNSVKALWNPDPQLVMEVLDRIEPNVNRLHRDIDALGLDLLALQQPRAGDLRLVMATMRINGDLERIGDRAVHIAEHAMSMRAYPDGGGPVLEIQRMAEVAEAMIHDALGAFVQRNEHLAREIVDRDDEVDRYRDLVFIELTAAATEDRRVVQLALDLILVSRNLERIADHATNIAEAAIFLVLGKDTRHRAEEPSH
jgi:phosphate transport system protein